MVLKETHILVKSSWFESSHATGSPCPNSFRTRSVVNKKSYPVVPCVEFKQTPLCENFWVKSAYNKVKGGHKRKELDSCIKRFHLFEGMTISVKELQKENEKICDILEKWKKVTRIFMKRRRSFI